MELIEENFKVLRRIGKKITVVCNKCGDEKTYWTANLRKYGCTKCNKLNNQKERHLKHITTLNEIHNFKFDYSKVKPQDLIINNKLVIMCDKGHEFKMTLQNHKRQGCPICSGKGQGGKHMDGFIERSSMKHPNINLFSFNKTNLTNKKVIITCKIHGDFTTRKADFMQGIGCPTCGNENRAKNQPGFYSFDKAINGVFSYDGILYVIEMFNDNEKFIKIGITKNEHNRMLELKRSGYMVKILYISDCKSINNQIILEHTLKKQFKKYSYIPKNEFKGRYECFKYQYVDLILNRVRFNEPN